MELTKMDVKKKFHRVLNIFIYNSFLIKIFRATMEFAVNCKLKEEVASWQHHVIFADQPKLHL
jgi:hypothetical protein